MYSKVWRKRERGTKEQMDYMEDISKMADFKPNHVDSSLICKWPKHSTRKQRLSDGIKTQNPTICYPQKPTLSIKT